MAVFPATARPLRPLTIAFLLCNAIALGAAQADSPLSFMHDGDKIVIPPESQLRNRLTVAQLQRQSVGRKLELPAVVEADPARTVTILPPLGGRVVALPVGLGDHVAKGQALIVIDSPDLGQAYDDNDKAEDSVRLAERDLQRQEQQAKIAAISERDLDQARSDLAQAQAEVTRTRARLRAIDALQTDKTKPRLLTVRAPRDGSITTLLIAPDSTINDPTQPVMVLSDLAQLWVTAMVPEKDLALVSKDQTADVTLAAYPDETLNGKVAFINDLLEPDSRRTKIRITFTNPHHRLKPNMFATVLLHGPESSQILLPTSALLMNNDRLSVFVETAPWVFERRTVEADLQDAAMATIKSGLDGSEKVVVKGGVLLND